MDVSGHNTFVAVWTSLITMNFILLWRKRFILRRWWTRPDLTEEERKFYGAYRRVFLKYKRNDHEKFYEFVGMSVKEFNYLHKKVNPMLTKTGFCIRKRLETELKLAAVLNFLVHGGNITKQAWFFKIGKSTLYKILPEVCTAICAVLKDYVSLPDGEEWHQKAKEFNDLYEFPNAIGIVDGKHIVIKAPPHSGAFFHNFKKTYSIVLMAACDAFGKILWASIGDYGSMNDAGNFNHSDLGLALETGMVKFPDDTIIPKTHIKCPYFFIADGGFSLTKYLLIPFKKVRNMVTDKKIFNVRLQRARKTIERVFGIMCKRWQILDSKLNFKLKTSELIVMSVVCLYNYTFDDSVYSGRVNDESSSNNKDSKVTGLNKDQEQDESNESDTFESSSEENVTDYDANAIRHVLCNYFIAEGSVKWQWQKI